jgi:hypothetical protein
LSFGFTTVRGLSPPKPAKFGENFLAIFFTKISNENAERSIRRVKKKKTLSDDSVYMPNQSHLDEYLLNDVGKVYIGSYKQPIDRDWVFGQFEDSVLPAAVFILDKSRLKSTERGNAVKVRLGSVAGPHHAEELVNLKVRGQKKRNCFWIPQSMYSIYVHSSYGFFVHALLG